MAKRTITQLVDDLDGSEATETVAFALDGTSYEIDLNERNAAELREALAPYTAVATPASGRARGRRTRSTSTSAAGRGTNRQRLADIRTWARQQGHQVSDRGRIPRHIADAYNAAHA